MQIGGHSLEHGQHFGRPAAAAGADWRPLQLKTFGEGQFGGGCWTGWGEGLASWQSHIIESSSLNTKSPKSTLPFSFSQFLNSSFPHLLLRVYSHWKLNYLHKRSRGCQKGSSAAETEEKGEDQGKGGVILAPPPPGHWPLPFPHPLSFCLSNAADDLPAHHPHPLAPANEFILLARIWPSGRLKFGVDNSAPCPVRPISARPIGQKEGKTGTAFDCENGNGPRMLDLAEGQGINKCGIGCRVES
jgi:hypothetical protein